jgi:very-short-patch-repair endonuclease
MTFALRANVGSRDRARELRRAMTEPEKKLWSRLRGRQVGNLKFRRQAPLEGYIVDFCCLERRLVIEVDGGDHAGGWQNLERTVRLEAAGYRVLRFWNPDVLGNVDGVVRAVMQALGIGGDGV